MLLIARAQGEVITIDTPGGRIRVMVMGPNGHNPKLTNIGVEAPREYGVGREERPFVDTLPTRRLE